VLPTQGDCRPCWPVIPSAGITRYERLPAGNAGEVSRGITRDEEKAGGRLRLRGQHNIRFAGIFVEIRRERRDSNPRPLRRDRPVRGSRGGRRRAREPSVHTVFRLCSRTTRMGERSRSMRLLPNCCPQSISRDLGSTLSLPSKVCLLRGVATGCRSALLSRFFGGCVCEGLPPVAPAWLDRCSIPMPVRSTAVHDHFSRREVRPPAEHSLRTHVCLL
jgi:hypothetical protein